MSRDRQWALFIGVIATQGLVRLYGHHGMSPWLETAYWIMVIVLQIVSWFLWYKDGGARS